MIVKNSESLCLIVNPNKIPRGQFSIDTTTGKIMRRVLKARELGQGVGDLSTLAD